jgi:hypothetical protein
MTGVSTPQLLTYAEIVDVDLDANHPYKAAAPTVLVTI